MVNVYAQQVADQLAKLKLRIVLAESCTGGKTASLLTEVPGISQWFCGSAVTYREATKQQWLAVPSEVLARYTAESQEVSDELALRTLAKTSEASCCCSITGHLGPGIEPALDGLVFLAISKRQSSARNLSSRFETANQFKGSLSFNESADPRAGDSISGNQVEIAEQVRARLNGATRLDRQLEAANFMLGQISKYLSSIEAENK